MLEVRLLGQFHVRLDDKEIEISSQVARALMAYLVIYESKKHSRETLVGLFWADSSPDIGRKYLRNTISKLQQTIGADSLTGLMKYCGYSCRFAMRCSKCTATGSFIVI